MSNAEGDCTGWHRACKPNRVDASLFGVSALAVLRRRLEAVARADDDGLTLPLTRSDSGAALDLAPVHVNRMLCERGLAGIDRREQERSGVRG